MTSNTPSFSSLGSWKSESFRRFMTEAEIVPTPVGVIRVADNYSTTDGCRSFSVAILVEDGGLKLSDGKTYFTGPEAMFSWSSSGLNLDNAKGRNFPVKARKGTKGFESSLDSWSTLASEVEQAIFDSYISGSVSFCQPFDVAYETKVHDLVIKKVNTLRYFKAEVEASVKSLADEASQLSEEHEANYPVLQPGKYHTPAERPIHSGFANNIRLAF